MTLRRIDTTRDLPSYAHEQAWLRYQEFFPPQLRIDATTAPAEQWWRWRTAMVHLDRYDVEGAPARLILLHGGAGYGRLLAPIGLVAARAGFSAVAPDLPGFGLTQAPARMVDYQCWIHCVCELVDREQAADPKPTVLFGASLGGPLSYQVAARVNVSALAATMLVDLTEPDVQRTLSRVPYLTRPLVKVLSALMPAVDPLPLPMGLIGKVDKIANERDLAEVARTDPLGGGRIVPVRLIRTLITTPVPAPEQFDRCRVVVTHPEHDQWVPPDLSRKFFDRLACPKQFIVLSRAGHLPIEDPGVWQLCDALVDLLRYAGHGHAASVG